MIPIVKVTCEYKKPLEYGDTAIVETCFVNSQAAKILFKYRIYRKSDNELVATGSSMQVFLTPGHELLLTSPQFFIDWKKKWGIL
jgi:acyl-CoA thioester hydrolase